MCELFGTATVAVNYWRGHQLASDLVGELRAAQESALPPVTQFYRAANGSGGNLAPREVERLLEGLVEKVTAQLSARWWLTAGLFAFAVGALAGLAAALLALFG